MTVYVHRNESLMQSEESALGASQIPGLKSSADVLKVLLAPGDGKWTTISEGARLSQSYEFLIILLGGGEIARLKVLCKLLKAGAAVIKKALQFLVNRV